MKIRLKLVLAAVLLVPVMSVGVVGAVEQTGGDIPQTSTYTPKTGNEGLSLQQRLEKRKTEIKTKLSAVEKTRVTTRCKAAQGKVASAQARAKVIDTRYAGYEKALTHLQQLKDKLKAKGVDTTVYEQQLAVLTTKTQTYADDAAAYKESLKDLAELDCAVDPDAFKASLETSRKLRAKVEADGKDIRSYYTMTIKPTLLSLRQQLVNKEGQNTEGGM
ncbi:MAG TPA: hypothetical protein VK694_08175 [Verrucomicrobiae bacterium]|nr:hypothetical protein [Verrucomicrobiae bacterium]